MDRTAKELGEFGVITEVIAKFCDSAKLGDFEDSMKFSTKGCQDMLLNIDNINGHLPRENLSEDKFITAGHICVTSTLNDIIVSGGRPLYFGTKIKIPEDMKESEIFNFFKGMKRALDIYNVKNLGGDTDISDIKKIDATTIAIGMLEKGSSKFSRNTSKEEDIIFLTAPSGIGWANLIMLKKVKKDIHSQEYIDFWNKHKKELESVEVKPVLPINAFLECSKKGLLSSATDITDGIGEVFAHDYEPRKLGMELNFKKEFLADCASDVLGEEGVHPINAFINHGMDLPVQTLITCEKEKKDEVIKTFQDNKIRLYEIGKVASKPGFHCSYENKELKIDKPVFNDGGPVNPMWFHGGISLKT